MIKYRLDETDKNSGLTLREVANRMLAEARDKRTDNIFNCSGFQGFNVSISHQQLRCVNLAWALVATRKVKSGSVVAIAGGGFSGMMMAVSLALQAKCVVLLFEKEQKLLAKYRGCTSKFLHPNLNSRDLPPKYDPKYHDAIYKSPIFDWQADVSSEVSFQWLAEFERFKNELPIFEFCGYEVADIAPQADRSVQFLISNGAYEKVVTSDILIDATGLGVDSNPFDIDDYSYWSDPNEIYFSSIPKSHKILISGMGDSSLIELYHYLFTDFDHSILTNFYPTGTRLESYIQPELERSDHFQICYSHEIPRHDRRLISELCWFIDQKWEIDHWPHDQVNIFQREKLAHLYVSIERLLESYGIDVNMEYDLDEEFVFQFYNLSKTMQFKIRKKIEKRVREIASEDIETIMSRIDVGNYLNLEEVERRRRKNRHQIVLHGRDLTPYTMNMSPINYWFLKVALTFPEVTYTNRELLEVEFIKPSRYRVKLQGQKSRYFNHVATRYGVEKESLSRAYRKELHRGEYLLNFVVIDRPTDKKDTYQNYNVAEIGLRKKIRKIDFDEGPVSKREDLVSRDLFRLYFLHGDEMVSQNNESQDPIGYVLERVLGRKKVQYMLEGSYQDR